MSLTEKAIWRIAKLLARAAAVTGHPVALCVHIGINDPRIVSAARRFWAAGRFGEKDWAIYKLEIAQLMFANAKMLDFLPGKEVQAEVIKAYQQRINEI